MSNFENDYHSHGEMAKAHTVVEFALENLELLLGIKSRGIISDFERLIIMTLDHDLKSLISFLKKVQETSMHEHPIVTGLLAEITSVIHQHLAAVDSYLYTFGMVKEYGNQGDFLNYFPEVADSVNNIESVSRNVPNSSGESSSSTEAASSIDPLCSKLETDHIILGTVGFIQHFSWVTDLATKIKSVLNAFNGPNRGGKNSSTTKDVTTAASVDPSYGILNTDFRILETVGLDKHFSKVVELAMKVKSVDKDVFDAFVCNPYNEGRNSSSENSPTQRESFMRQEKMVIGLDDEARELCEKLIGGWGKLEVISIIGMGGIGKTTLANKLYDDPSVVNHFHLRAWTSVSQLCFKRNLLHNILSSILNANHPIFTMTDDDMGEKLYQCLKGNRFLIVVDDIWDIEAWNNISMYFPHDSNGSRILMTTRSKDLALKVSNNPPLSLSFLTQEKSWDLFKYEVFVDENFPKELIEIGTEIVANCKGLPLAIVVVAGFLAKEVKTLECWREVAQNIGSAIRNDSEKFMDILELSFKKLPSSLKSCFLYVGSFHEDCEIPAKRLVRSWIAEGFIQRTVEKTLEDVAEEYLTNLVNRSLVISVKKRSNGGIKSCRVHDMLKDLCHWKAKEKTFVQQICKCRRNAYCYHTSFSDCPCFHFYNFYSLSAIITVSSGSKIRVFRLLKTLDLRNMELDSFPKGELEMLIHLKYLAIRVYSIDEFPSSIFELWRLQTFILDVEKGGMVTLTSDIYKMARLRHFQVSKEMVFKNYWKPSYMMTTNSLFAKRQGIFPSILSDLQTISHLRPSASVSNLLARTPNLQKLGFYLSSSEINEPFNFPNLSSLVHLNTLKFENQTFGMVPHSIPQPSVFPPSLKKMTLVGSHVKWTEMSLIGMLPNLEILKIKDNFFSGSLWETSENGFRRLKFLKLSHLDIQKWICCSSDHFPELEWLVINGCEDLEEIPSEIGEIRTIQIIEVYRSAASTAESARQIQESQRDIGNEDLKVFVYPQFQE